MRGALVRGTLSSALDKPRSSLFQRLPMSRLRCNSAKTADLRAQQLGGMTGTENIGQRGRA